MPGLYPAIEPYERGMLDMGDGNLIYWETCGNPRAKPALVIVRATDGFAGRAPVNESGTN